MNDEIKLTREEEREIDNKLGPDFKKKMTEFADKLTDLMFKFPLAQGGCKQAQYLRQPFAMMSSAVHLARRFGMSEEERDKDDAVIAAVPQVIRGLAGADTAKPQRNCDKFRDVDTAYNQFMSYVKRENPSSTKAAPLHTVWDALKWVLDSEKKEDDA